MDDDDEGEDVRYDQEGGQEEETQFQELSLSKISAYGFDGPKTMKLMGVINGNPVVAMIDSGATHSFIAQEMVAKLGLEVDDNSVLPVRLGDGKDTQTFGLCSKVGNAEFEIAAYVFPVTGMDIILGVTWLSLLGDVLANWADIAMAFTFMGKQISLKGDPRLAFRQLTVNERLNVDEIDGAWMIWAMEMTHLGNV